MLSFLSLRPVQLPSSYQGLGVKTLGVTVPRIFEAPESTQQDKVDSFEPHYFSHNVFEKSTTHNIQYSYQYSFNMIYLYIFSYQQNYK